MDYITDWTDNTFLPSTSEHTKNFAVDTLVHIKD